MKDFILKLLPKLVDRHEGCVGLRLFKWGQRSVQLWYCPKGYTIEKHSHDLQDIELCFLYGEAWFYKTGVKVSPSVRDIKYVKVSGIGNPFKTFSIPAGTVHWFSVSNKPLWFLNYAKWKPGYNPTSAAIDFVPAKSLSYNEDPQMFDTRIA